MREVLVVEILQVVLQVILGITSLLLTLMILLHRGRGGGLSDMFGGGGAAEPEETPEAEEEEEAEGAEEASAFISVAAAALPVTRSTVSPACAPLVSSATLSVRPSSTASSPRRGTRPKCSPTTCSIVWR